MNKIQAETQRSKEFEFGLEVPLPFESKSRGNSSVRTSFLEQQIDEQSPEDSEL